MVANIAHSLIALKSAQYYVKRAERLVSGEHAETMDFLAFDLEKAQDELVKLARLMQSCNHAQEDKIMSYINEGDLLISKAYGTKYIAASSDYIKRMGGTGEFLEDWRFVPAVDTLNPETGHRGFMLLRDVEKVNE